jgi:predicted ATPase
MGQIRESMYWAERMLQEGETRAQDDLRLAGHTAVVLAAYFLGQFSQVRGHARSILELYDPVRDRAIADLVAVDPKTYALVYDALAQWALGYPDQAATIAGEAIEHARARGHAFDLGWTLQMTAKHLDVYRRDPEACADRLDEFERVAHEQSIEFFEHTVAPICRAAWLLLAGRAPEAETGLRESIPRWTAVGLSIDLPLYKTLHAQSAALSHQLDLALELMGEVLEQIERPGCEERSFFAEALRVKGDILQLRGDVAGAEAAFSASLAVSRTQLAKSWELRTASSYASLLLNQHRREEALQLLQPTYEWFTEGFETRDLKDARALLDKLEA